MRLLVLDHVSNLEALAGENFGHRRTLVDFCNLDFPDRARYFSQYLSAGGILDLTGNPLDGQSHAHCDTGALADIDDDGITRGVRDQSFDGNRSSLRLFRPARQVASSETEPPA